MAKKQTFSNDFFDTKVDGVDVFIQQYITEDSITARYYFHNIGAKLFALVNQYHGFPKWYCYSEDGENIAKITVRKKIPIVFFDKLSIHEDVVNWALNCLSKDHKKWLQTFGYRPCIIRSVFDSFEPSMNIENNT
jgi:hypothetical protein